MANETFNYSCPQCGFVSAGWQSQEQADARGEQHEQEHKDNEPMPELIEFQQSLSEENA